MESDLPPVQDGFPAAGARRRPPGHGRDRPVTVALGSLGAIGGRVAEGLARRYDRFRLVAASAQDRDRAAARLAGLGFAVPVVAAERLADEAEIVIEAAPPALFRTIAEPAVARGRVLILASVGQLLAAPDLIEEARRTGARLIAITGAIAGLDAVRAAALDGIDSARLVTRKMPHALAAAPYLRARAFDPDAIRRPTRVFEGDTRAAAEAFPASVNVGAALALAGCGPERTMVEVWADPAATRTTHAIRVEGSSMTLDLTIAVVPGADNPRSSTQAPLSILAALDGLVATVRIGS